MPDWESELRELLEALDVSPEQAPWLDGYRPDQSSPSNPAPDHGQIEPPDVSGPRWPSSALGGEHPTFDDVEIGAVRREMEATVARVVYLARVGKLDRSLRDDVVYVLQALTRPQPTALPASERHEWHLGTAAAVLHFCRVVMRLTPPSPPPGPV